MTFTLSILAVFVKEADSVTCVYFKGDQKVTTVGTRQTEGWIGDD